MAYRCWLWAKIVSPSCLSRFGLSGSSACLRVDLLVLLAAGGIVPVVHYARVVTKPGRWSRVATDSVVEPFHFDPAPGNGSQRLRFQLCSPQHHFRLQKKLSTIFHSTFPGLVLFTERYQCFVAPSSTSHKGADCKIFKKYESGSALKLELEPELHLFSSDADPDLWIRICIIRVGSGSVWRDTNPDPGHIW